MQSFKPTIPGRVHLLKIIELENHVFWWLMLFYIHLLLLLQPSVLWFSIVTFNNDAKPLPKWIWCTMNSTLATRVTPPWNVYMVKFDHKLRG